ncbi:MAG TPA: phosphatidylserine decarboxylase family protein, partial [Bacteroidales bacterium]|nr:phosphatidylserine decarboxylase family protein [Bacteroidales bacterium]
MKIHKEGYNTITFVASLLVISIISVMIFFPNSESLALWVLIPFILLLIIVVQFFRSPQRPLNNLESGVISPADGQIVVIEETREDEYFKMPMRQVSIFMSPVDVHLNRYPVTGKLLYFKHHPGKFLVAWNPKSSILNERTSVAFETTGNQPVFLRQVAGFLARRIVFYGKVGGEVTQGNELGFIKFGSRVDLMLPLHAKIDVKIGDKVKAGITSIARFEPE